MASPAPPKHAGSEFFLPPTDWGRLHSSGRWHTKSERFPTPPPQSVPFHCHSQGTLSAVASQPNGGHSFRSKSPRFAVSPARSPDVSCLAPGARGGGEVLRGTSLKTSAARFAPPKIADVAPLGPARWASPGAQASASYRSRSPRFPPPKPPAGEAPPPPPGMEDPVNARRGSPARAAFRYTSPRFPSPKPAAGQTSPSPVVLPNGTSAVCARTDHFATAAFKSARR